MFVVMNICNVHEYLLNVNEFYTGDSVLYLHTLPDWQSLLPIKTKFFNQYKYMYQNPFEDYIWLLWGSISNGVIKTNKINNKWFNESITNKYFEYHYIITHYCT